MGASISTNKNVITQRQYQKAYNSCGKASSSNIVHLNNYHFSCPPACGSDCHADINQQTSLDATCVIDALQASASQWATTLDANAQTGLGFAVSTNIDETTNNIKSYVESKCGDQPATNVVDYNNVDIQACTADIVQNASSRDACKISTTQNIISNIVDKSSATSIGFWGGGWGKFTKALIALAVISAVAGIIVAVIKSHNKSKGTSDFDVYASGEYQNPVSGVTETASKMTGGDFTTTIKKNKSVIIIAVLALLFIVLILVASKNTSAKGIYLTNQDFNDFQQRVNEAKQLAGIQTPQQSPYQTPSQSDSNHENKFVYPPSLPINDNRVNNFNRSMKLEDYYKPLI